MSARKTTRCNNHFSYSINNEYKLNPSSGAPRSFQLGGRSLLLKYEVIIIQSAWQGSPGNIKTLYISCCSDSSSSMSALLQTRLQLCPLVLFTEQDGQPALSTENPGPGRSRQRSTFCVAREYGTHSITISLNWEPFPRRASMKCTDCSCLIFKLSNPCILRAISQRRGQWFFASHWHSMLALTCHSPRRFHKSTAAVISNGR